MPITKRDLRQRFLSKEAFKGALYIAWGAGFLYYAQVDIKGLYEYAARTGGAYLLIEGLRLFFSNRVKAEAKLWAEVEQEQDAKK